MTNPPPANDERLAQAYSGYVDAQEKGQAPDRAEYLARYPECAAELAGLIDAHRCLNHLFSPWRPETTIPYRPAEPGGVVQVALPTGPTAADDLQDLLRWRLRLIAVVTAVGVGLAYGVVPTLANPDLLADSQTLFTKPPRYGVLALVVTLQTVAAVLLSPRRSGGLGRLRALEVLVYGPQVAGAIWGEAQDLAAVVSNLESHSGRLIGAATSVSWVLFIVGYGVVIPNTWRRCATGVSLFAVLGLLPHLLVLITCGAPAGFVANYLATKALLVSIAAVTVVLGAHRLEILETKAAAARHLGQYRLGRRLGAGGMGEVYLAEHVLLRRDCAIKLIRPDRSSDATALKRFEREVQTTATLTHPNTVQIYDYGHAEDGTFYYVMEYLPGLTLAQLVQQDGRLPIARAVHLVRQVCGALREAHAAGLIHRDIKPGNIMICERGGVSDVVKLLDFGLVRLAGGAAEPGLTGEHTVAGTAEYMAPEQAAGRADIDHRADLYALGAVAYFLLTGRPPFGGSVGQILAAHQYEPPPPLSRSRPEVPAALEAVVLRCLEKDAAARFPDAKALDDALADCSSV
jgi:serine/threonine-protein kinase